MSIKWVRFDCPLVLRALLCYASLFQINVRAMVMLKKILIFLGAPGSGKGTQAAKLAQRLSVPHISTGDLFRENIKEQTQLGRKAQEYMDKGNLVPDGLVLDMLFDRVGRPDCERGYILDGFPRRITQADAFQERLQPGEEMLALNLKVSDEEIIKRLTGRLTCRSCGAVFHRDYNPPELEGVCDSCGGELYQRPDDSQEVVQQRLAVYKEETKPLIEYYQNEGALVTIEGERPQDEVFDQLVSAVEEADRRLST